MATQRRGRGKAVWIGGFLLALAGCATVETTPKVAELLWPPPPLTPRIKFVGLLSSQEDLGRDARELFLEALVGKRATDSLFQPMGVAPSRDGKRLYVTDYVKRGVFVFDFEARRLRPLGDGDAAEFARPFGIAVDDRDHVYVVDSDRRLIRVFDPTGKFLRDITHQSLERPTGIALDPARRRIYVADSSRKDSDNHVVHVFDLDGTHLRAFGGKGIENGRFFFPTYLAVDGQGKLYVTDTLRFRVQIFDPDGRHLMNIGGERGNGFGMFDKPKGVAVDSLGNVYVVDSSWSNVQIFNSRGEVLLYFAGRGQIPGLLFNPTGIAIDKDNRIYVADAFNGRVAIYQLINTKAEDSFLTSPAQNERGGDTTKPGKKETSQNAQPITQTSQTK